MRVRYCWKIRPKQGSLGGLRSTETRSAGLAAFSPGPGCCGRGNGCSGGMYGPADPSEEAIKQAWGEWHDEHVSADEGYQYQYSIGTSKVVLWPDCVLVDAFDVGGEWMTLVMRDDRVVDVFDGHNAGRRETAQEHGCS